MSREGREAFSDRELEFVERAVRLSRDLTGHYFALPDDWFEEASHVVCTRRDQRRCEILDEGFLAQIRRLYRVREEDRAVLRCQRLCPHYRICLQDRNILQRLREDPALALPELLTWVMTHEYVHLVRFCRLESSYETGLGRREEEETRVEGITRCILSRLGGERLRRAAERLRGYDQD